MTLYGIVCRVTAYSTDFAYHCVLAVHSARSVPEAVTWLQGRAARLADALDPDPASPWYPTGTLHPVAESTLSDPASLLRAWTDDTAYEQAVAALDQGTALALEVHDSYGIYALTIMAPAAHPARGRRPSVAAVHESAPGAEPGPADPLAVRAAGSDRSRHARR